MHLKPTFLSRVLALALLLPQMVTAQRTLYVSNLGQTPAGNVTVGSDAWVAQTFSTGTNSAGYDLTSVQLLMGAASGTPSGFAVPIFSKTGDPQGLNSTTDFPKSSLGSLAGSDPALGGLFTYSTPGITLSSSTFYFVVLTASTDISTGAYHWSAVPDFTQSSERWLIANVNYQSPNVHDRDARVRQNVFQLGIYASPVPEPPASVLTGLGLVGMSGWRRKHATAR